MTIQISKVQGYKVAEVLTAASRNNMAEVFGVDHQWMSSLLPSSGNTTTTKAELVKRLHQQEEIINLLLGMLASQPAQSSNNSDKPAVGSIGYINESAKGAVAVMVNDRIEVIETLKSATSVKVKHVATGKEFSMPVAWVDFDLHD